MNLSNLYRLLGFTVLLLSPMDSTLADKAEKPNVLFVAIDDLNDWVGCFGGHPQAITPNLDRFAEEGSVVFQNAHCPGLEWKPTLTIRGEGNASVHDDRRNLIVEKNGGRELYDLKNDPMEWTNLFGKPEVQAQQAALGKFLPARYVKRLPAVEKVKGKSGQDKMIRPRRLKLDLQ